MPIPFTKMHGLGNDYVYIELFTPREANWSELARAVSDRHRGVGSDGLILVAPPAAPGAHARMIMFNADGSRAQMCGNGVRCVGKLVYERGWARQNPLLVETDAGVLRLELSIDGGDTVRAVRVDMGAPILEPDRIPVRRAGGPVIDADFAFDPPLRVTCVSMGNPHAVFFCEQVDRIPLHEWGPRIEHDPMFPQRVNVHFVEVRSATHVRMRTWERGAGLTQACGTGAAAVCVAGVLTGRAQRALTVTLPGGDLQLAWDEAGGHVFKTGPAVEVFRGEWPSG